MAEETVAKKYEMPLQCRRCRSKKAPPFLVELYVIDGVVHIVVQCQKERCQHQSTITHQSLLEDVLAEQKQEEGLEKRQQVLAKRTEQMILDQELRKKKAKEESGRY